MPKYLLKASYNAEGVRGVMKEGGSKREAAARALVKSLGGKVESFYFCHGDADAIVICDFPDLASALAGVMAGRNWGPPVANDQKGTPNPNLAGPIVPAPATAGPGPFPGAGT